MYLGKITTNWQDSSKIKNVELDDKIPEWFICLFCIFTEVKRASLPDYLCVLELAKRDRDFYLAVIQCSLGETELRRITARYQSGPSKTVSLSLFTSIDTFYEIVRHFKKMII